MCGEVSGRGVEAVVSVAPRLTDVRLKGLRAIDDAWADELVLNGGSREREDAVELGEDLPRAQGAAVSPALGMRSTWQGCVWTDCASSSSESEARTCAARRGEESLYTRHP